MWPQFRQGPALGGNPLYIQAVNPGSVALTLAEPLAEAANRRRGKDAEDTAAHITNSTATHGVFSGGKPAKHQAGG